MKINFFSLKYLSLPIANSRYVRNKRCRIYPLSVLIIVHIYNPPIIKRAHFIFYLKAFQGIHIKKK